MKREVNVKPLLTRSITASVSADAALPGLPQRPADSVRTAFVWAALAFFGGMSFISPWFLAPTTFMGAVAFINNPRSLLWLFFMFHWLLYVPFLGPELEAIHLSVGPVNIYLNDLFFLGLFALVAAGFLQPVRRNRMFAVSASKWVILYLVYLAFHMVKAMATGVELDAIVRESSGYLMCVFFLYALMYIEARDVEKIGLWFYRLWLFIPIFQVVMIMTGQTWITDSGTERTLFIGPNIFFLLVIAYKLLVDKLTTANMLVIAYMLAGMAMTQYRSAFVALLAMGFLIGFLYLKHGSLGKLVYYPVAIVMLGIMGLSALYVAKPDYVEGLYTRYFDSYDVKGGTINARAEMWAAGMQTFKSHPLFGIGVGRAIFSDVSVLAGGREWSPHNFVVRLLAKQGVIGLFLVSAIVLSALRRLLRWRGSGPDRSIVQLGLVYTLSLLIVHSMNATFAMHRVGFVLWLFLAFMLIYVFREKDGQQEHDSKKRHDMTASGVILKRQVTG